MTMTGPAAIADALRTFSTKDVEKMARDGLQTGKKTHRSKSVKLMRYAQGLRNNNIEPSDYLIKRVPVIPPKFRPFSVMGESFIPGSENELYKDLFDVRDSYDQIKKHLGEEAAGQAGLNVYDAAKASYGFGEAVVPKTKQRGAAGFLKKITGNQAKLGFFQRRMISKPVDMSARGVIGVDPDLTMDEVGIPWDMGWKVYAPYIHRRLVRSGYSGGDAAIAIRDRTEPAKQAMLSESKERPVMYSRAPAWHKYNIMAGTPKFIDGESIHLNPLILGPQNADFDGDQMNVQVPGLPEAVSDAKEKLMPSKMLFAINKRGAVMPKLGHEYLLGLFSAQKQEARQKVQFSSKQEALAAIRAGQVDLSDEIDFPN